MCEGMVNLRDGHNRGGSDRPICAAQDFARPRTGTAWHAACGAASSYECHDYDGDTRRWRRFSSW